MRNIVFVHPVLCYVDYDVYSGTFVPSTATLEYIFTEHMHAVIVYAD